MAIVKTEPVRIVTTGGHEAIIDGIDLVPSDGDLFIGTVTSDEAGPLPARWNSAGICRDCADTANLDTHSEEFRDLLASATQLGLGS